MVDGAWGMGGGTLYLPRMYKTIVNNGINYVYIKYTGFLRSYGRRFWEIRFFLKNTHSKLFVEPQRQWFGVKPIQFLIGVFLSEFLRDLGGERGWGRLLNSH